MRFDYKSCTIDATTREAGGTFFPTAALCRLRAEGEALSEDRKNLSGGVASFRTSDEAVVFALNWAIGWIDDV
ncbi:hypothetical protein AWB67_07539 [Caballeronia terrestris]|uniref:Uncharacterized protein n=2 Tax=Caballeronia TaxID=1827195 RepID=A0A158L552_9BURK|nr:MULTISPECIES: hypothetical protein [Caballeronia]SAL64003.1 hypothetical protein AWB65_05982 [Caballeronia humi]SAL88129.1 hypothetical protein AWB67_07539 [Caballeronia terrestris]